MSRKAIRKAISLIMLATLQISLLAASTPSVALGIPPIGDAAYATFLDPSPSKATDAPQPDTLQAATGLVSYADYLRSHARASTPDQTVDIDIFDIQDSKGAEIKDDVAGSKAVVADDTGFLSYIIDVPEAGLYSIYMEYYTPESRSVDIERRLYLNGEIPFKGADALKFSRVWMDAGEVRQDNRGNEIRPSQAEDPRWQEVFLKDAMGYYQEPYKIYLGEGENTIKLESINEPIAIRKLSLRNTKETSTYEEMLRAFDTSAYNKAPEGYVEIKQGEEAIYRSSPTLYAIYDRSSPGTEPYSIDKVKFNMIGGVNWNVAGQWIEWDIEVPEDGFYNLTFKSRQNYNRGNVSIRQLTIDGEVPFSEVGEIGFEFSNDWQMTTLCDSSGEPYLFPLAKGIHTIRLEAALGDMGGYIQEASECVNRLTRTYRQLLVVVGTTPDKNRDYQIDKLFPEVMEYFEQEAAFLYDLVDRVTSYTGQRGEHIAAAQVIAKQFERFLKNPDRIPRYLANFRINIGSLATFLIRMSDTPLDIDYIVLSTPGATLPETKSGFFAKLLHEVKSFFTSFFVDYSSIGDTWDDKSEPLHVWILTGRDQSQILKNIIDDTFTPEYGIAVNLKLVTPTVLLPAVVAGTGPDIALQVPNSEPVNFALRNSVVNLTEFEDFDEIRTLFYDSAFTPLSFDGGVYALPEMQSFQVMFYREDILSELGLDIPETWDDVLRMLPVLQNNSMDFGLAPDELLAIYVAFLTQLYQREGRIYTQNGDKVLPDDQISVEAFEFLTQMYSHYKMPKIYNFPDRFRTGEMPIGVADFTTFNTLMVSAPEIRGLWDFTLIPGVMGEDGIIHRQTTGGGPCSMMFPTNGDKEAAWTFMKWWVSTDTQVRFGREMEALLGAAARHPTANVEAFEQLGWSQKQREVIREQWGWVVGTPEVPGGYYTSRHILNAFRKVSNKNEDARETLLDYSRTINDELTKKRKEFGLE